MNLILTKSIPDFKWQMAQKGMKNINWISKFETSEFFDEFESITLFSEPKIYIIEKLDWVKNAKLTKKEEQQWISFFERNKDSENKLIILSDKVSAKKGFKPLEYLNISTMPEINTSFIRNYVSSYLDKYEKTIELRAIETLIKRSLNSIEIIQKEIEKLSSLDAINITDKHIQHYTFDYSEDNVFQLVEAILKKNKKKALEIYENLSSQAFHDVALLNIIQTQCINTRNIIMNNPRFNQENGVNNYRDKILRRENYDLKHIQGIIDMSNLLDLWSKKGLIPNWFLIEPIIFNLKEVYVNDKIRII